MAYQFRLPDLGEGIHEGHIVKWLVKEGDKVEEHQEILEVETDKALVKVPSPKSGTILSRDVSEGDVVKVGQVMCSIGAEGEKPVKAEIKPKSEKEVKAQKDEKQEKKTKPAKSEKKTKKKPAKRKGSSTVIGELEEAPEDETLPAPTERKASKRTTSVKALPAVRKLAEEMGVELSKVQGSGPSGRITEDDVKQASGAQPKERAAKKTAAKGPSMNFDAHGRTIRIPLRGVRKAIAENMVRSKTKIPHVTHTDLADVTKLAEFRKREKERAEEKGVKLTFLPFIIKAVVLALKEFPYMNTSLDDNSQEIVIKQYYNIGIAVDTQAGLMVPVIHRAESKTILELARDIYKLAEKARTRTIKPEEMSGGTFTITNVGSLGGWFATPVINHPEAAILALGRIQDMAIPIGDKFTSRKMLPLSLAFDHRIVDGALAAKFVNEVKKHLEDPDNLLMGY